MVFLRSTTSLQGLILFVMRRHSLFLLLFAMASVRRFAFSALSSIFEAGLEVELEKESTWIPIELQYPTSLPEWS